MHHVHMDLGYCDNASNNDSVTEDPELRQKLLSLIPKGVG